MACEQELRLAAVKELGATNLAGLTVHMLLAEPKLLPEGTSCCPFCCSLFARPGLLMQCYTGCVFSTHLFTAPFLLNPTLSVTHDQWNFSTSALHNVRMALHHIRKECHSGLP